jgi:hypothetical protein
MDAGNKVSSTRAVRQHLFRRPECGEDANDNGTAIARSEGSARLAIHPDAPVFDAVKKMAKKDVGSLNGHGRRKRPGRYHRPA